MNTKVFGIDFGTSTIKIYRKHDGVIFDKKNMKNIFEKYSKIELPDNFVDTWIHYLKECYPKEIDKNLVDTYAEIVKSRRVLAQVIEELDLDMSYEELSAKISVSAVYLPRRALPIQHLRQCLTAWKPRG